MTTKFAFQSTRRRVQALSCFLRTDLEAIDSFTFLSHWLDQVSRPQGAARKAGICSLFVE